MTELRIKCPNCGKQFVVKGEKLSPGTQITCPSCNQKYPLSAYTALGDAPAPGKVTDETQIGALRPRPASDKKPGYLIDRATGREYQLKEGINLIGRMTYQSAPRATVPIETQDMGVSRSHLYIEVIAGCDDRLHTYAYNASNANPTYINDALLNPGDKIGLTDGSRIRTSETLLVFRDDTINDETVL